MFSDYRAGTKTNEFPPPLSLPPDLTIVSPAAVTWYYIGIRAPPKGA
jgi:hypothetical protein